MSSKIVFALKYFRQNENIEYCFSSERNCRLSRSVDERPWVAAFERLLRKRQGLQKQKLAELGNFSPGRISTFLKGPKQPDNPKEPRKEWPMPDIATLQMFADALTKWDRDAKQNPRGNPKAPAVQMWEFFVSDDQAELLHRNDAQQAELVTAPPDPKRQMFAEFLSFMETKSGAEKKRHAR